MTDVHILTIAVALTTPFLAVMVGVFLNNNRLNDVKELTAARIEVSRASLSLEIAELRSKGIAELRVLTEKNHSEILVRFAELENRLGRIEFERRIVSYSFALQSS